MACTLIEKVGVCEGLVFGVLDTPCYPARYYGGVIRQFNGEWYSTDNASCNYFEDQSDAYIKTVERFECWQKTVKEREEVLCLK